MAPKRPTQSEPENSPDPKRRAARVSTASAKKRENDENLVFTKPKRASSKKKRAEESEEELEDEDEEVDTQFESVRHPSASTRETKTSVVFASPSSPVIDNVASCAETEAPVVVFVREEVKAVKEIASTMSVSVPVVPLPVVPLPVTLHKVAAADDDFDSQKNVLGDEQEVISLWEQAHSALSTFGGLFTPVLLFALLVCYAMSQLTLFQTAATVGVVFGLLGALIMGSFFFLLVPFILISRAIACLFSDRTITYEEQRSTVLYARLALLFTITVGTAVIFSHA